MARKKGISCNVVDQHCLAPAGYGTYSGFAKNNDLPLTLPECPSCGQPVCKNCSYNVPNGERWCADCFTEEFGDAAEVKVTARRYRLAGYSNCTAIARRELRERAAL